MRTTRTTWGLLLMGSLLLLGFSALYFTTRTGVHTFDALSYTQDVRQKPVSELYHPHHLLYAPAGRLALNLARGFGYTGAADSPIQALNAVAGGLGVVLLWVFGSLWSRRPWLAAPIAALIGLCYAYWFYATEVEVYTLAAVFLVLAMIALLRLSQTGQRGYLLLLGLATSGAIMFHQTNTLLIIPVACFLLMTPALRSQLLPYSLLVALTTGLPYLLVAYHSGLHSPGAIYDWATGYAQSGEWGGYLSLEHRAALWAGLRNSISPNATLATLFYLLLAWAIGWGWRRLAWAWRVFALVWLLLYAAFFWWWEPWNIEFWIALLPLAAFWCFAALPAPLQPESAPTPRPLHRTGLRYAVPLLAGLLALLLLNAHYGPIRRAADPQQDYYQQITRALAPQLHPTDLVISRGNILDLYLPYYADQPPSQVLSLRELRQAGYDAWAVLQSRITPAYTNGHLVYIDALLLDEVQNEGRNPFGLAAADIARLRESFPIQAGITYQGQTVFYRIGERLQPDTRTWRFDSHLGGWTAFGAHHPRFTEGAWCIDASPDPWLESPPLHLDATTITQLRVTLSLEVPADEQFGQLFWQREGDSSFTEEHSLRFPLEAGRHSYTLSLAEQPAWAGRITALRLDPSQGAQGSTCLLALRLR